MTLRARALTTTALTTTALLVGVSACTSNADDAGSAAKEGKPGSIAVTSSNDACTLSATKAPSGTVVFTVKNTGSDVTEFYLLGKDGVRVVGEVENIGPGLTRKLVTEVPAGSYKTACKPGMKGDGIQAAFTVTDSGDQPATDADMEALLTTATDQYAQYVQKETDSLVEQTNRFAELYTSGKDDEARALYAPARVHWERIEPVAESFGDLDPKLDLREADLEPGQDWTGWHAIEKDLWPEGDPDYTPLATEQRQALADQLVADTNELSERVETVEYTPSQLGNGAKELLDEVATGKVTGEEEAWSHTDLWDFQANVDGARVAYENLQPALEVKDPKLSKTLASRFAALQEQLDQHRQGDGFVLYTQLTPAQVKQLSDSVNALSEPLSQLTSAVVL